MNAMQLIDGKMVPGGGREIECRAIWDDRLLGSYRLATPEQAELALTSATNCRTHSVAERQVMLQEIAATIRTEAARLVQILVDEIGKPVSAARAEVERMAITFSLAVHELDNWGDTHEDLTYDPRGTGISAIVRRFPLGPVFAITPYNWPYNLAAHKIAPAIATGCPVIIKGSPLSTLSTLMLSPILQNCGCVQILACDNALAEQIASDDRVAMLSFTGSPSVGWYLKSILNKKKVTLELGGDATAILTPSTDVPVAVQRIVQGAFSYAGQICISVQHALIHESIYEETKRCLIDAVANVRTGNPTDSNTLVGPMISAEAACRVEAWIEEMGPALVRGKRKGNLLEPSLLEWGGGLTRKGVPRMMREEVFGPVLVIQPYRSFQEALDWVNSSQFGIQTGVFTLDDDETAQAFEQLNVSGVVINHVPTLRFDSLPYGGHKTSGIGREGVRYAMEEMSVPKSLVRQTD